MRTTEHARCSYHTWRTRMHSSAAIRELICRVGVFGRYVIDDLRGMVTPATETADVTWRSPRPTDGCTRSHNDRREQMSRQDARLVYGPDPSQQARAPDDR